MNKTTISLAMVVLLLLSVTVFAGTAVAGIDKRAVTKNPAPYDDAVAPISSIGKYILEYKDALKNIEPVNSPGAVPTVSNSIRFNLEAGNLPQIEEAIASWKDIVGDRIIVGGASDLRGFHGIIPGASGYYVSNDEGATVLREGALPSLTRPNDVPAYDAMSAGNPSIDVLEEHGKGTFYYSSRYIDFNTVPSPISAVGLARAVPKDLQDSSKADNVVWKVIPVVAEDWNTHFFDNSWTAVDNAPSSPNYEDIYVTFTAYEGATGNSRIWLAQCKDDPSLAAPDWGKCNIIANDVNPVSDIQTAAQGPMVNVDSVGNVIVTWIETIPNKPAAPYFTSKIWYRVYSANGIPLLAPEPVESILTPVTWWLRSTLGNEFPAYTKPWSEVALVNGVPRLLVTYQKCVGKYMYDDPTNQYADTCGNANVYLKYVDNYQSKTLKKKSVTYTVEGSSSRHGLLPTMSIDKTANILNIGWYQSEDNQKHDLYVATQQRNLVDPSKVVGPTLTKYADDPDAETYPLMLGWPPVPFGVFIGDYFQIFNDPTNSGKAFVHFTGNNRYSAPYPYVDWWGNTIYLGGNNHDNRFYIASYP